jgi:nickel-dependent lactate racemase
MIIDLAFGRAGLTVDLPGRFRYRTLEAHSAAPLTDPENELMLALETPIGSPGLRELARGKRSAAISVCDITRPAPNRQTLPPVLACLEQAGIPREAITIMIATGLHRAATNAEIREICGREIASDYRVVNHDARDLAAHRFLGATTSGTPVYIDDRFCSAELHLTLGFIEPHLMLGFSGGRKLVAPGLAAQETIKVLHSPKFMRDPRSAEGCIEDNPLHQELLEIARIARHDFLLDVVLTRDRAIAGVFAGDPVEAHRKGVAFLSRVMLEQLEEPVDGVITTGAGYPLDLTFYQAIKGITAASHIVKPGGRILLIAACEEGAGASEFQEMLRSFPSDRDFMTQILNAPVTVDQWQLEKLGLVTANQRVFFFVPGLPAEFQNSLWGPGFQTVESAIEAFTKGLPDQATIAVIPDGPYVLAKALSRQASLASNGFHER